MVTRRFDSLGRGETATADLIEPDRYRFFDRFSPRQPAIARGAGLSLAGAGFRSGGVVVGMRRFDRLLAFDPAAGTVTVEAGVTLEKLFRFLTPRGWGVAAQPGYPALTVGGCIAGNVHGKNQAAEGCFGDHVRSLVLWHPAHGVVTLSPQQDAGLFDLTVGGFGLTGIILSATLGLVRLPGTAIRMEAVPVASWDQAVSAMAARAGGAVMLGSWHDLSGVPDGHGFVFAGQAVSGHDAPPETTSCPDLAVPPFPVGLFQRPLMPVINRVIARTQGRTRLLGLWRAQFPFADKAAYFRAYGPRGFVEHQTLIPRAAASEYFSRLQELLRRHPVAVGLATLKIFSGAQRLLRFSGDGISLALEVANTAPARALFAALDGLDVALGCRANLIKDARLPAETVARQYPGRDAFVAGLRELDGKRPFASALSERLQL